MNNKGFTLVELAIVLIIISLLIGGILVAQSMIKTSQINGIARQIAQYDAAIANFQTTYNQLPGDSNLFLLPGNNNGEIRWTEGGLDGTYGNYTEEQTPWLHLSLGVGLKNYKNQDYSPTLSPESQDNCPRFKVEQNAAAAPCLTIRYGTSITGNRYYYRGAALAPLKPVTTFTIDKKMDDGIANTGKLIGSAGSCSSGANYTLSNDDFYCGFLLQVGTTTGGVGSAVQ